MKIPQYKVFAKRVLDCKNLLELKEVVKDINEFNKKNSIRSSSEDFQRLETYVGLMKIKLKNKMGVYESKKSINEQFNSERLYPKDYIVRVIKNGPKELRPILKQLQDIPCSNDKGEETVCTKIPEFLHVYLTGRY